MNIVWVLLIGAVAGWLSGLIMKGRGFGIIGNIVVGIVGAIVGGYALGALGVSVGSGLGGTLLTAVIGAVILLTLVGIIKKAA